MKVNIIKSLYKPSYKPPKKSINFSDMIRYALTIGITIYIITRVLGWI